MSNYDIIRTTLKSQNSVQMFEEIFGSNRQAQSYIASALLAVRNNDALMECSAGSIATAALRAATLRLSCDPGIGQAYLVPFKGKATLVIGYKGLKDLAIRTGKYRFLNVATVREGMTVQEDIMTGQHTILGGASSQKSIGYMLYFELMNGFSKTFYMSVEEIHQHAQKYSKSYGRADSPWKTSAEQMEKKTVLRLGLTRWGYFDPADMVAINQLDDGAEDESIIDGLMMADEDEQPRDVLSEAEALAQLGYDAPPKPAQANKTLREKVQEAVLTLSDATATDTDRKMVAAAIDGIFNGEKTMRYEVCDWLVGRSSTQDMTGPAVAALKAVLGVRRFDEAPSAEAMQEFRQAHAEALKAKGQMELPTNIEGIPA